MIVLTILLSGLRRFCPFTVLIPIAVFAQNAPAPPKPADLIGWLAGTVFCIQLQGKNTDSTTVPMLPQGSGFLVSRFGYVLTNSHVIRPQRIKNSPYSLFETSVIRANFHERCDFSKDPGYDLEVIAYDEHIDVALLKVKQDSNSSSRNNWRYIPLGDSDQLRPTDKLITFGFPNGRSSYDADGQVRSLDETKGRIQFKGPIEPGYSGGPVLDERGYVVGIVWGGILDRSTANYFIPVNFTNGLLQLTNRSNR